MADDFNWSALSTVGTFVSGIGSGALLVIRWFTRQRKEILNQVAELRTSHERHVMAMQKAHGENAERFVRLESHEQHTQGRLDELLDMLKELNRKNDRQVEMLMNITKQGRR